MSSNNKAVITGTYLCGTCGAVDKGEDMCSCGADNFFEKGDVVKAQITGLITSGKDFIEDVVNGIYDIAGIGHAMVGSLIVPWGSINNFIGRVDESVMPSLSASLRSCEDTYKAVCVNTEHFTDEDRTLLEKASKDDDNDKVMGRKEGWIIKLFNPGDLVVKHTGMSDQYNLVINEALKSGYRQIEIDGHGEFFPQLAIYA